MGSAVWRFMKRVAVPLRASEEDRRRQGLNLAWSEVAHLGKLVNQLQRALGGNDYVVQHACRNPDHVAFLGLVASGSRSVREQCRLKAAWLRLVEEEGREEEEFVENISLEDIERQLEEWLLEKKIGGCTGAYTLRKTGKNLASATESAAAAAAARIYALCDEMTGVLEQPETSALSTSTRAFFKELKAQALHCAHATAGLCPPRFTAEAAVTRAAYRYCSGEAEESDLEIAAVDPSSTFIYDSGLKTEQDVLKECPANADLLQLQTLMGKVPDKEESRRSKTKTTRAGSAEDVRL